MDMFAATNEPDSFARALGAAGLVVAIFNLLVSFTAFLVIYLRGRRGVRVLLKQGCVAGPGDTQTDIAIVTIATTRRATGIASIDFEPLEPKPEAGIGYWPLQHPRGLDGASLHTGGLPSFGYGAPGFPHTLNAEEANVWAYIVRAADPTPADVDPFTTRHEIRAEVHLVGSKKVVRSNVVSLCLYEYRIQNYH